MKNYYNVGIAVDTPDGLVVPVVQGVDRKTLVELAVELGEISIKARDKKLKPSDMQGGCITISSLGGTRLKLRYSQLRSGLTKASTTQRD